MKTNSDSVLVRDLQLTKKEALDRIYKTCHIENDKITKDCLKKKNVSQ